MRPLKPREGSKRKLKRNTSRRVAKSYRKELEASSVSFIVSRSYLADWIRGIECASSYTQPPTCARVMGEESQEKEFTPVKVRPQPGSGRTKRILVTGGAGFVGSHLCEYLVNRGDDVSRTRNEAERERAENE